MEFTRLQNSESEHSQTFPDIPSPASEVSDLWEAYESMRKLAIKMARWIEANDERVSILAQEVQFLNNQIHQHAQNKSKDHWLPSTARVLTKDDQLALIRAKEEAAKAKKVGKGGRNGRKRKQTAAQENPDAVRHAESGSDAEEAAYLHLYDDSEDSELNLGNGEEDYLPSITTDVGTTAPLRRSARHQGAFNAAQNSISTLQIPESALKTSVQADRDSLKPHSAALVAEQSRQLAGSPPTVPQQATARALRTQESTRRQSMSILPPSAISNLGNGTETAGEL
ncbi:SubName: Full=Uncharacterized protein {ECO:0000313/EMBL:CCA75411.1} [Serendipita indica DSM 11827]|nr:SubName: Full=Uncharacterized protein {ECO:0000313/EMBL:CCA75411.1} [Serendipita indica DSM 11827]